MYAVVEVYLFSTVLKVAINVFCREMKDSQFLPEKVANKVAKELFEKFQEYERIYQKIFAGPDAASVVLLICINCNGDSAVVDFTMFYYDTCSHVR